MRSYRSDIILMLQKNQRRLVVSIDHVRDHSGEMAEGLLVDPFEYTLAFNHALKQIVKTLPQARLDQTDDEVPYYCAWAGSFGLHACNPRTLSAHLLNQMVSLEGIVTRCSLIRRWTRSSCSRSTATRPPPPAWSRRACNPREDDKGNPLTTEYGLSTFRDSRPCPSRRCPSAPRPASCRAASTCCSTTTWSTASSPATACSWSASTAPSQPQRQPQQRLVQDADPANNVVLLSSKSGGGLATATITDTDLRNINRVAKKKNLFELLSQSLAPSIHGHDYIKKAILLMLLGGMEKNLENGTHLRGDINILMVGDPSTAKSQLLRFVLKHGPARHRHHRPRLVRRRPHRRRHLGQGDGRAPPRGRRHGHGRPRRRVHRRVRQDVRHRPRRHPRGHGAADRHHRPRPASTPPSTPAAASSPPRTPSSASTTPTRTPTRTSPCPTRCCRVSICSSS